LSAQICPKPTVRVNTKIKLTTAVYLAKDSFDWDVPFSKSIRNGNISDFLNYMILEKQNETNSLLFLFCCFSLLHDMTNKA